MESNSIGTGVLEMTNKELKYVHSENRAHVIEKEYEGTEFDIPYAVNAPMNIKLYGNAEQKAKYIQANGGSIQKETVQGKNLFDKNRYTYENTIIRFDISLLEIGKVYTLSTSSNIEWFKISNGNQGYNSVAFNDATNGFSTYTFTMTRDANIPETLTQYLYISVHMDNGFIKDIGEIDGIDIQIEEGTTATEYEPFVPTSPSVNYPSEIIPSIAADTYKVELDDGTYEITIPDMYGVGEYCDKVIIDEVSKTARLKQEIYAEQLDNTKSIEANIQAILTTPTYAELPLTKVDSSNAELLPLTAFGKNLFDMDILGELGWSKQEDGSYYVEKPQTVIHKVLWENKEFYTGQLHIRQKLFYVTEETKRGAAIQIEYTDGTIEEQLNAGLKYNVWCEIHHTSIAGKIVKKLSFTYGSSAVPTYTKDIVITKDTSLAEYEPFNPTPPESLVPSKDYPHKIYPSSYTITSSTDNDTLKLYIPNGGYAVEVNSKINANLEIDGKYYIADILEYDDKENIAIMHSYIDESLFDYTKPILGQIEVVKTNVENEVVGITENDYNFSNFTTLQDDCTITTTAESELLNPLWIDINYKALKTEAIYGEVLYGNARYGI